MKKNIITLPLTLSLLVSHGLSSSDSSLPVTTPVESQAVCPEVQTFALEIFSASHEMLKKAVSLLDAFFSKDNNEPIKNHLIHIGEILDFIEDYITRLDAITQQQPPNSPDHQLLQQTNAIVKRVQKGITQLKIVLENHQKQHGSGIIAFIKRNLVVSSLASELRKVKQDLLGDFATLDQELTVLYNNLNNIYNNAVLAGKLKAIQEYIQILRTRKGPSDLALLGAIAHRVNCQ